MRSPHSARSGQQPAALVILLGALSLLVLACGNGGKAEGSEAPDGTTSTLRLGYLANLTHAPAIVGIDEGLFQAALGPEVELEALVFASGTETIEALFSGAIDAAFVGPNPAINGFAQSEGDAVRIVAGTTSGGAALVVRPGIETTADLVGGVVASPALGNSQDVALRTWLAAEGYPTDREGSGAVSVRPQDNATAFAAFASGAIDGAWVPEPWATRLVGEAGGHVLVDERSQWPDGEFVTTQLIVAPCYLGQHPDEVTALITGLLDGLQLIADDPTRAMAVTNDGLEAISGKRLDDAILADAWSHLRFTYDPIAGSLQTDKDNAVAAGLLDPVDLAGIYALDPLTAVLIQRGLSPVAGSPFEGSQR